MGAGEDSRTDPEVSAASDTPDQDALLDDAIRQADQRLVASLQKDELRRRRRRWWALGGTAMTITIAVVAGLILSSAGVKPGATPETAPAIPAAGVRQVDPKQAALLTTSGWQLAWAGKWDEANPKFEAAVKLDPSNTNAWNGLGWCRVCAQDDIGAVQAFKKCVELEPDHPPANKGLGQIYFSRRHDQKAEAHWLKVADKASGAQYGLAKMYLLQGKYAEAAKWAEKMVAASPDDELAKRILAAAKAKTLGPELRKRIEPAPREYEIGPGDVVEITIHELIRAGSITTETRTVSNLGNVNLPILGKINLNQMTEEEAEAFIKSKLTDRDLLAHPIVNVVVREKRQRTRPATRSSKTIRTPLRTTNGPSVN